MNDITNLDTPFLKQQDTYVQGSEDYKSPERISVRVKLEFYKKQIEKENEVARQRENETLIKTEQMLENLLPSTQ